MLTHGPDSIWICRFTSIANPIVKIRRLDDRLTSTMGICILVLWYLYIAPGPWFELNVRTPTLLLYFKTDTIVFLIKYAHVVLPLVMLWLYYQYSVNTSDDWINYILRSWWVTWGAMIAPMPVRLPLTIWVKSTRGKSQDITMTWYNRKAGDLRRHRAHCDVIVIGKINDGKLQFSCV